MATEVGTDKKVGLGVMLGFPSSLTMKAYLHPKVALSLHLGGYWFGLHGRTQLEFEIAELQDWKFARFDLYGIVGGGTDLVLYGPASRGSVATARPEAHAGAGVELQFHDQPAAVYMEVMPVFWFMSFSPAWPGWPVGVYAGTGGRWYF